MTNKKELENTPICHIHNIIQDTTKDTLLKTSCDNLELIKALKNIIELSKIAEQQGQKMEDRLRVYKEGIESLGFKRDK